MKWGQKAYTSGCAKVITVTLLPVKKNVASCSSLTKNKSTMVDSPACKKDKKNAKQKKMMSDKGRENKKRKILAGDGQMPQKMG